MALARKVVVSLGKLNQVAATVIKLILRKNQDYGDAWQQQGVTGVLVRISDKALRLRTLADGRQALVVNEQWEDTLRDLAGYALLGLLLEESREEVSPRLSESDEFSLQPVGELVLRDLKERLKFGRVKYGGDLLPFDDDIEPLLDAYEEILDSALYLRQFIEEHRLLTRGYVPGTLPKRGVDGD